MHEIEQLVLCEQLVICEQHFDVDQFKNICCTTIELSNF